MSQFIDNLGTGFYEIGQALSTDLGVWWLLTPIFILWIAMEIYLGEYKQEELGFSSTLANGFSLFWISLTSFRVFLFLREIGFDRGAPKDPRFYILIFFLLYAVLIMYISFTHKIHERIVRVFAGPSVTYFFSALAVLWSQRLLGVNISVLYALTVSFAIITLIFFLISIKLGLRGDVEHVLHLKDKNPTG